MSAPNQALIDQFELPHTGEGSPFQISVARVTGLSSDIADVPVFFVMDADFEFAVAAEIVRLASMGGTRPGAIVVGIGYGTTDFSTFSRLRTSDLTPAIRAENIQSLVGLTALIGERYGGAEALLTFLIETLVPEIAHRYPDASTSNRALFGHSLGGLFTAYALLSRPDAFPSSLQALRYGGTDLRCSMSCPLLRPGSTPPNASRACSYLSVATSRCFQPRCRAGRPGARWASRRYERRARSHAQSLGSGVATSAYA
ncbi:alpha/beta hydrolase [Sphingobium sp. 15-1]|nr:alpha/beta hydrolase-fold protein [Sphingobium sp. 15-1]